MDLKQRKLNKSEWDSTEIPVSESELSILNMIIKGYHDVSIKINKNNTIIYKMNNITKDDKKKFIDLGITSEKKTILSPGSGVDLNYFRLKKNILKKKTKFLFFGRLLKEKGIREFINASNK